MEEVEDLFTELRKVSFLWVNSHCTPKGIILYRHSYGDIPHGY
jgi:hypothetical protein